MVAVSLWHFILVVLAGWVHREQLKVIEYLKAEMRALLEQFGNKRLRFTDAQRRRLAVKGHALAMKYDGREHRRPGRPKKTDELRELVITMVRENPGWGYTRTRDALGNLGHEIARNTIKAILRSTESEPIGAWAASSSCRPPTSTGPDRSYAGNAWAGSCAFITQMRPETSRSSFRTLPGPILPSSEGRISGGICVVLARSTFCTLRDAAPGWRWPSGSTEQAVHSDSTRNPGSSFVMSEIPIDRLHLSWRNE
jgi:hypothetical protein